MGVSSVFPVRCLCGLTIVESKVCSHEPLIFFETVHRSFSRFFIACPEWSFETIASKAKANLVDACSFSVEPSHWEYSPVSGVLG